MCSLSSQSDATCFTAHLEAAASLPLEKKQQIKKNNPQTKPSPTAGWFKRSGLLPRADAGLGLLLGILLLSLLGAVLAGLFLLFAALVLFVLVTPMTLPLLALVLLAPRRLMFAALLLVPVPALPVTILSLPAAISTPAVVTLEVVAALPAVVAVSFIIVVVFTGGRSAVSVSLPFPLPLPLPLPLAPGARVLPMAAAGTACAFVHRRHPGRVGRGDGRVADET